jgi:Tol biopolymer transport system component
MHIWRMRRDGTEQEQITFNDVNNWFPDVSPDGRRIVFLTYDKDVTGHPRTMWKDSLLRIWQFREGLISSRLKS